MFQNLIVYSVESATDPSSVKTVRLEGRFYRILEKAALKQKLAAAAEALFASQHVSAPTVLLDAIESEQPTTIKHPIGDIEIFKGCGPELPNNNQMCWIAVTINR